MLYVAAGITGAFSVGNGELEDFAYLSE